VTLVQRKKVTAARSLVMTAEVSWHPLAKSPPQLGGSMQTHFYALNTEEVHRQILDQGLKKWWVAEFSGVHKTTLRRWLNGKISRVKRDNVERLASLLSLPLTAITSVPPRFVD